MPVYVSDLFTATPAPVNASPASTRTWQWLRGSSAISGATSSTYTAVTADIGSTLSATQLETNFLATTTATSAATEVVQAFDPIRLFSASEPGVWYDPSDMSTLFQNAAGTIPVTSFGQPVGLMLDKSRGLVLGPELVVNGTFDSATGWTLGTGWTISDGVATQAALGSLTQLNVFTSGVSYEVSMDVVSVSAAGDLSFQVNGVNQTVFTVSAPTTIRQVIFAGASGSFGLVHRGLATWRGTIDNVSVKELPGLHATQSTEASRPLYGIVPVSGRRNLLTYSEQFDVTAAWAPAQATITANSTVAPDGTTTAELLLPTAALNLHGVARNVSVAAGSYCISVYAKAQNESKMMLWSGATGYGFDLSNGTTSAVTGYTAPSGFAITSVGNGWYRCSITVTTAPTENTMFVLQNFSGASFTGNVSNGIYLWGAQLELGSTPTAYQRVSTDLDVTETGVASVGYLRFDGSTSWMSTPTITPGTDKVQVFAGVRKLIAQDALLVELSADALANNGAFIVSSGVTLGHYFGLRGSAATAVNSTFTAPQTSVQAVQFDIAGAARADEIKPRINGAVPTLAGSLASDAGTGNFLAYQMYIGKRGGSSLALNGHLFPLIVRFGPTLTAARIAATEAWVATKTGGVTL